MMFMSISTVAASRARDWAKAAAGVVAGAGARIATELRLLINLQEWAAASDWRERLAAVSWPRAAVVAGVVLVLGVTVFALLPRPDAYRHPDPTAREIELRQDALEHAPPAPPPGLVDANKSVTE